MRILYFGERGKKKNSIEQRAQGEREGSFSFTRRQPGLPDKVKRFPVPAAAESFG
jgi:hypothetical protein